MNYKTKNAPTIHEFSTDTLILPCLMALIVLNQKNCGWPSTPDEFQNDNDLKAQIVLDLGYALNSIWCNKAINAGIEWAPKMTEQKRSFFASNNLHKILSSFNELQEIAQEVTAKHRYLEVAKQCNNSILLEPPRKGFLAF